MELTEPIDSINKQLRDEFGVDTVTGQVIWRVVWSEDQYENRLDDYSDFTPGGLFIRSVREVRLVPKYDGYTKDRYVLERLVVVPIQNMPELPGTKISYEPLWIFEDKHGNPVPPAYWACKFVVDTVYAAQYGNHNLARYKNPEGTHEGALEAKRKRVDEIQEYLFGEQSALDNTTVTGESIIVPRNYEKSEK
jgi:hypothetical protein